MENINSTSEEEKSDPKKYEKCEGCRHHGWKGYRHSDSGNLVWFLGVIGSAVFFLGQASTFGEGVIGFLKALVWPAVLVFRLFQFMS